MGAVLRNMEMLLHASLAVVLLASSAAHQGFYCKENGDLKFCGFDGVITSVLSTGKGFGHLTLHTEDVSSIVPNAFLNVSLRVLEMVPRRPAECTRKTIELTPESFDSLSVWRLNLQCLMLPITLNPFKHLRSLEILELANVGFDGDANGFYLDFPNLHRLRLVALNITTVTAETFSGVNEGLQTLEVSEGITAIEPNSFGRFGKLRFLYVTNGRLTDVQADMFTGLDSLLSVDLSNNDIRVLRNNTFRGLPGLGAILLNHNKIDQVEFESCSSRSLSTIDLSHNKLENFPIGFCQNVEELAGLYLSYNKLRSLPDDIFKCRKLRNLDLDHNEIHHVGSNSFRGLHLRKLNLAHNQLTSLEHDAFGGLHADQLDLRFNDISEAESQAFGNSTSKGVKL